MHQSRLSEDLEFLSSDIKKKPPSLREMCLFQCPRPQERLTKFRPQVITYKVTINFFFLIFRNLEKHAELKKLEYG